MSIKAIRHTECGNEKKVIRQWILLLGPMVALNLNMFYNVMRIIANVIMVSFTHLGYYGVAAFL